MSNKEAGHTPPEQINWLARAVNAFSTSDSWFNSSLRMQMERDIRQFQGRHASDSKYLTDTYRSRSKLFRPKTRSAIRSSEATAAAAFFSTEDVVTVTAPDDNDEQKVASAELNKALLQYRLSQSNSVPWFLICMGAYQEAQAIGAIASVQEWDFSNDRPRIELIPPENLRIDPGADWIDPVNSSPYIIHLMPMYAMDVRARANSKKRPWKAVTNAQLLAATQTQDSIRLQREHGRLDPKEQNTSISDYAIVWVRRYVMRTDNGDVVFYTLGDQALLSDPAPISEEFWHGRRPYVLGTCFVEAHRVYPASKPALTREIQAEINEITNQRIDNVKFAMNKRYFVKRNRNVDVRSLVRNSPSSVTMMTDPESDVKVVETNDVTSSSYNEQDRLNLDFDDLAGTFSGSSVQSNRRLNETVGGMQMMSGAANQVGEYELRTFAETWVEPVLRQVVLLEQYYESDEMILAVAGERAKLVRKFGLTKITDKLLMQDVITRVNVGVGSTNTFNQLEKFIYALEKVGAIFGPQALQRLKFGEVVKEIFGKVGYKDGSRFFVEPEDPEIAAMMQTIEELQSALAAKHPPELIAAQVKKLLEEAALARSKRVHTGVQAAYSAVQAGATVAATPALAPVADEIMRGAGYQADPSGQDPNIPSPPAIPAGRMPAFPTNTSPAFPAPPRSGMTGIETSNLQ